MYHLFKFVNALLLNALTKSLKDFRVQLEHIRAHPRTLDFARKCLCLG